MQEPNTKVSQPDASAQAPSDDPPARRVPSNGAKKSKAPGLKIARRFTEAGEDVWNTVEWEKRSAVITGEKGNVIFEQHDVEVPAPWSQLATNVVASKYFRGHLGTPERESSVRQLIRRVAYTIADWGKQQGYFASEGDYLAYRDELTYILLHQKASFNSPVWFNVGLADQPKPQCSACFINSVQDTMESILTLAKTEGMLFKFGSGTGTNFSTLRSSKEKLHGGGTASGPVSFMRGYDAFAGVIKCLTPDAYIYTDRGLRPLSEVIDLRLPAGFHADESVVLATKDGPARISHVYVSPEAPTFRLKLRHTGLSLRGTGEHPVLTLTPDFRLQWKRLLDLAPGDRVAVSRRMEMWPAEVPSFRDFQPKTKAAKKTLSYPTEMTPELARLLGYMVSEGCLDDERFRFSNADEDTFNDFLACVRSVFGVDPSKNVHIRVHPKTGVKTWVFEACFTNAVRFLKYVGLTVGHSDAKSVPWSVRCSPRSLVVEFLRAYFEGDGHVSTHVYAASASKRLLDEVQLLMLNMGLVSQLRLHPVNGKTYWCLYLRGEQAWAFVREVGFVSSRKKAAAEFAGDKNTDTDVVPFLVDVLRPYASRNGYFRCADGVTRLLSFRFFNRKPGAGISYNRLRSTPGLVEKVRALDPARAETLEVILEREFFWDAVASVEADAPAVTYDFTVPDTHSFVANGILNHNSGGKTRRAAKMVILNIDHPDIKQFITCKAEEEKKAWALIEAGYDGNFNVPGGAYDSVSYQNANHSVRVTDEFMRAYLNDEDWHTRYVLTGEVADTYKARELMRLIAESAWICGDPGIQYDTTINKWHTCKNTDRIYASNPCFTGDSLVHTNKGLIPFRDLIRRVTDGEEFLVVTHDATSGEPQPHIRFSSPTQYMVTGIHDVIRLRFSNGAEVTCTPNHRFFTLNRGMVPADQLEPNDRVLMTDRPCLPTDASWEIPVETDWQVLRAKGDRYRVIGLPLEWSEPFAELLGHLTGAGSIGESIVTWIYGPQEGSEELLPRHRMTLRAMGIEPNHCVQTNGTQQLRVARGPFRRFLESLGYRRCRAAEKRVPPPVCQAPPEIVAAYLRGLFTADGCAREDRSKGHRYVGLGSKSEGLLIDVQRLLLMFGIQSRIYMVSRRKSSFHYTRKDGTQATYSSQRPSYDLRISGASIRRFHEFIGFSLSRKQEQLDRWVQEHTFYDVQPEVTLVSREPAGTEITYNLTEPTNHTYVVNGFVVANCSEYMFLNDSACNLASLNLMKFRRPDGEFDVESFQHACRIMITAQEIIVDNASYPTEAIAKNSHDYRPLGLGYANLGALLMARGIPYDSDAGRALAAAITAVMTGEAYHQSAIIARDHGWPFPGYEKNREPFLEVMRMHRAAVEDIQEKYVPADLITAVRSSWDNAIAVGEKHGFRNAQTTVIAPTGTISFMMDCDTTGIEPDIAIVKYKNLVGGGVMKIVNNTVPEALHRLGYSPAQVEAILAYISEHDTIEDAPELKPEHLPIFDCAFKPAKGTRSIHYMGHVKMMAAAQPFISGAISKTVNMPHEATPEDIMGVYVEGWKLGLKAIAIYRDGSKRTQPLVTKKTEKEKGREGEGEKLPAQAPGSPVGIPLALAAGRPIRRKLPDERKSITHKFSISGYEGYITVGMYEDGTPGEIFLTMSKEGSTISGLMDTIATMTSLALQYGVPLETLVNKFAHTRFEPSGITPNPEIRFAKSITDYIFRWLGLKFLPREALPGEQKAMNGLGLPESPAPALEEGPTVAGVAEARPGLLAAREQEVFRNQADAPVCADCGSVMVRNGACYKCLNCGSTLGCS